MSKVPTFYRRYRLVVAYNGVQYYGWQRQKNQIKTVQQCLEMNYGRMYGEDEEIRASSRTDRGVHAFYNTCDVEINEKKNIKKFIDYINRKREDIFIKAYTHVDHEWNSRQAAKERTYIYRIVTTRKNEPKELKQHVWFQRKDIDLKKMKEAAKFLEGKHDFSSFMSKTPSNKNVKTTRKIREIKITSHDFVKSDLDFPKLNVASEKYQGEEIRIKIRAKSFLYHQVRIMVAYLYHVGIGTFEPKFTQTVLKSKDRKYTSIMAPPHGLYLFNVKDDIARREEIKLV